ncbi:hypothetical protein [Vulcanisaeta souniana]|uniref:Uncharacterized protein n=1 Tax=Vulcanisaeta souniana JCM 11219 TaxID=1293586 RepID=A0A830E3Y7_9CREN|nr:hypothetical protein [Vulcanisaeta souniana]BDR90967.1 hypothetical protein Vsou_00600 [Vulcanisaeta souniana JCM 11219]GGI79677.1 hypothetical protein GCM10007112_15760 [Vulcanisaeta souniana JCM 11219]
MRKRGTKTATQEALEYQLNWPIKLRELSIKLQDKSYKIVREAIKQYINGLLDKDTLMEIIKLSGIPLNKHVNPQRYIVHDDHEETLEDMEETINNEFEEVHNEIEEVREEYLGQGVIRRLMGND